MNKLTPYLLALAVSYSHNVVSSGVQEQINKVQIDTSFLLENRLPRNERVDFLRNGGSNDKIVALEEGGEKIIQKLVENGVWEISGKVNDICSIVDSWDQTLKGLGYTLSLDCDEANRPSNIYLIFAGESLGWRLVRAEYFDAKSCLGYQLVYRKPHKDYISGAIRYKKCSLIGFVTQSLLESEELNTKTEGDDLYIIDSELGDIKVSFLDTKPEEAAILPESSSLRATPKGMVSILTLSVNGRIIAEIPYSDYSDEDFFLERIKSAIKGNKFKEELKTNVSRDEKIA